MKQLNTILLFSSISALSACGSDAQTDLSDSTNNTELKIIVTDVESNELLPTIKNNAILSSSKSRQARSKRNIGDLVYNKSLTVKEKTMARWLY